MMHWAGDRLKALGASVEYVDIGRQTLPDGSDINLPPVIMGQLGSDPQKKTLLVYGHLDVQPAAKEDGWDYEPFVVGSWINLILWNWKRSLNHVLVDGGRWQAIRPRLHR